MGDLQFCYRQPNGLVAEDRPFPPSPLPTPNPDPSSIGEDNWVIAEQTIQDIVFCIQPTLASELKRKEVIEYVQRLITCCLGLEVFSYGSVPLKTYLPDGDIDLTALGSANVEEALARDVLAVLQGEEHNENAEYDVKDTQFIDAEVKLVKCLIENIVIDISFNQLGGICTLCFLEQVDRLVGKSHLFKRSIILIKAWCYYESRILGAHHGLISTYALETLVLYIFHMFHSSLNGPLAVLYRFLDYFSKFDWENYCISLNGPVCKSSLPDIVVDLPENCREDFMFSEEFLKNCTDMFSVPSRGIETNLRAFPQKHLNIIDPLKENNNLGRSVHRGSFYRIRCAFKYGARKLGQILLLPSERTADEIKKFFANTLERHGSKLDANLQNYILSPFHSESFSEDEMCLKLSNVDFDNISSQMEEPLSGDVSSRRIAKGSSDSSSMGSDFFTNFSGQYYYALHFYSPGSFRESENFEHGNLYQGKPENFVDENLLCTNNHEGVSSSGSAISSPDSNISESISLDFRESCLAGITGDPEALDPHSDLSGDYESHIRSLLYGLCFHEYALSASVLPDSPSPTSHCQNKKPWEVVHRSMPLKRNSGSQANPNSMALGQPFYPTKNLRSAGFASGLEEKPKARGTGTYFPNTNGSYFRERPSLKKGWNQVQGSHGRLQGHFHDNGFAPAMLQTNLSKEGSHEYPHPKAAVQSRGKNGLSHHSHNPMFGHFQGNGFSVSSRKLEFGSLGHLAEANSQMAKGTSRAWVSTSNLASLEVQSSKPVSVNCQERVADKSFQLKNEDDFPPLSF